MPGIKYTVTAETAVATANTEKFFTGLRIGMQNYLTAAEAMEQKSLKLRAALNGGFGSMPATTQDTVRLERSLVTLSRSSGGLLSNLTRNRVAMLELGHTARATTDILLMGGGPRMLLAQIPQVMQALSLAGVSLAPVGVALAGITAALATGASAWAMWKAKLEEAESAARLMRQQQRFAFDLKQMLGANANRLEPGVADALKKRLDAATAEGYRIEKRQVTIPAHQVATGYGAMINVPETTRMEDVRIETERLDVVEKEVRAELAKVHLSEENLKRREEIRRITYEQHVESLEGVNKERVAEEERYRKVKADITDNAKFQKLSEDAAEVQLANKEAAAAHDQKLVEIEARHTEELKKQADLMARANEELDRQIISRKLAGVEGDIANKRLAGQSPDQHLSARQRLAKETANYDEEYQTRIAAINQLYMETTMGEQEYTQLVNEATRKRIEAAQHEKDAKLAIKREEINAVADYLGQAAEVARAFGRQGFAAYKALAIAQANVAALQAGMNAWEKGMETGSYYGAVAFTAISAAFSAAQIAQIANQSYNGYQRGGFTGTGRNDEKAGYVHHNEFVINAEGTAAHRRLLEDINAGRNINIGPTATNSGGQAVTNNFKIIQVADVHEAALEAMNSSAGEKVVMMHLRNNRGRLGFDT